MVPGNIWQTHYTSLLEGAGFKRGRSNGAASCRASDDLRVLVHGDDFLALGDSEALESLDALLRSAYELKRLGTLGFEEGDTKTLHFLNRLLKAEHRDGRDCFVVEGDQRHVDLLISQLGLESAKGVETPDAKKSAQQQLVDSKTALLDNNQAQLYRSLVMRAAYLFQDRSDISHAVKNLSRRMVCPNEADLAALKRLARYLRSYPYMSAVFHPQMEPNVVRGQVDSDTLVVQCPGARPQP